jgi:anhydro-N-acetylmuramic acid kinase
MVGWLERLGASARKSERTVVGLISGTSADAIDAAVCRVSGAAGRERVTLLHYAEHPYDTDLRPRVLYPQGLLVRDIAELHVLVAEAFARACVETLRQAGIDRRDVDVVGSHGQTVYHHSTVPGALKATLQLGDGDVIAERTGLAVVSDFRARDVAAGGEGAPLTPRSDMVLFAPDDESGVRRRAVLNLGGIANVTVLDADPTRVFGFDTGPANAPLDRLARRLSGGALPYDRDGALARAGRVDEPLLDELLQSDPFLARRPPKSTGFEMYGDAFLDRASARLGRVDVDLMATLTEFVARSVADALTRHVRVEPPIDELVVAGGGAKNPALLGRIAALLAPVRVRRSDDLGVPSDAREAMGFAVLADLTLRGLSASLPAVTGSRHATTLGKISLPAASPDSQGAPRGRGLDAPRESG